MGPHIVTLVNAASTLVGLSTGLASAVVQATGVPPVHPFTIPVVSAAVGGIVSFAVLKTTVQLVKDDMRELKGDVKDIGKRLARIEGELGSGND